MSKKYTPSLYHKLIYLFFVSFVAQFIIAVAYLPYILLGVFKSLQRGRFINEGYETDFFIVVFAALIIYFFFIFLFKKFTLDAKLLSEKLLIFLIILIINCIVHLTAFLNMFFPYFISFVSILSIIQTSIVLFARDNLITVKFAWIPMIIAMIGGLIMGLYLFPFIWLGETILKLTNHQFNLFWFDYSGSGFIYISLWISIIYFCVNYVCKFINLSRLNKEL